jgi:PAS domain S-box-containing protein
LKKFLQNIETHLNELQKFQDLIQKTIDQDGNEQKVSEYLTDLAGVMNHFREAYLEFNLVTQTSIDVILRISATGKISYISPSSKELVGYEPYEIIGTSFTEYVPEEKIYDYTHLLLDLFRGRGEIVLQINVKHRNGTLIPVEINGRIINLGGKYFAQATIRDIRQRIESQKRLEYSENIFRTIWNKSSEGMLLTDEDGYIFMCNDSYAKMICKHKPEIEGTLLSTHYDELTGRDTLEKYKDFFRENSFRSKYETCARLWNGLSIEMEVSNTFIENLNGKKYLLSILRDVSERKIQESLLKKKDNLLQGIAEATKSAISFADIDNGLTKALRILGIAAEVDRVYIYKHQVGQETDEMFVSILYEWSSTSSESQLQNPILQRLSYSRFASLDFYGNFEKGKTLKFLIKKLPAHERIVFVDRNIRSIILVPIMIDGKYWGFIGFDDCRTDRIWSEDEESFLSTMAATIGAVIKRDNIKNELIKKNYELDKALLETENAAKIKSEFLALVSHEIRTPMNGVLGLTGLLFDTELSNEQREYVESIRLSGDQLLVIINDILDFSKIESQKIEIENLPFNVRDCLEDSFDLLATRAGEKKLDLIYSIESDVPSTINGDVTRVRQVLTNLLGNAVKFTEEGEIFVSVSAVPIDSEKYELKFAVRDTGIGIPEDKMYRLFQPFTQVDVSTNRTYGGTGLGLVISKRLTELMGGRMWAESKLNQGSTFSFTIIADAVELQSSIYLQGYEELEGKKVLIIDDNEASLKSVTDQALAWNMLPMRTMFPQVALDLLKKEEFNIAIIDGHMPFIDGVTLIDKIRKLKNGQTLPAVLMMMLGKRDRKMQSISDNLISVITKPVKHNHLRDTLRNLLSKKNDKSSIKKYNPLSNNLGRKYPLKILLAEDNVVNQKVALKFLERMGYRSDVAANGLEVLDAVQKIHYDIVFMDLSMPEMDGIETSKLIVNAIQKDKQPIIIAMTANRIQDVEEECVAAGMSDFIEKPVKIETLEACLAKWGETISSRDNENHDETESSIINEEKITFLQDIQSVEDASFLLELLDVYISDLPRTISKIQSAIELKDPKELMLSSHKLKGSSLTLGMDSISEISIKLENAAKGSIFNDNVKKLGEELNKKFEIVEKELEIIREKYNKFINQT